MIRLIAQYIPLVMLIFTAPVKALEIGYAAALLSDDSVDKINTIIRKINADNSPEFQDYKELCGKICRVVPEPHVTLKPLEVETITRPINLLNMGYYKEDMPGAIRSYVEAADFILEGLQFHVKGIDAYGHDWIGLTLAPAESLNIVANKILPSKPHLSLYKCGTKQKASLVCQAKLLKILRKSVGAFVNQNLQLEFGESGVYDATRNRVEIPE